MSGVRYVIALRGTVQGVGFRPHVFRIANSLGLTGYVRNDATGLKIEAEGPTSSVEEFQRRLLQDLPPHARIGVTDVSVLEPAGFEQFRILDSPEEKSPEASILPDLAVCDECLVELFDSSNRRFRYPFINCTHCGPRFSIMLGTPYDRVRTTMSAFDMCADCRREYEDPADRRFHAQPNACPACGPHVELWDGRGHEIAREGMAIESAAESVLAGRIVALKGLGGFQLIANAMDDTAVRRLRARKGREEKPFALMMPDTATVRRFCILHDDETRMLASSEAPIVLLERLDAGSLSPSVAPGMATLGVMLPYTPLHALLMDLLRCPIVATSGNRSDEPMCTDEFDALVRLNSIADMLLVHNRPIVRHVDDSIVRRMGGRMTVLRRARGFAPWPHNLSGTAGCPILCLGAHQKNSVAWVVGNRAMGSQHVGDLDTFEARNAFVHVADDLQDLLPSPGAYHVVCDLHPDYASTIEAEKRSREPLRVQHHAAHTAACRLDNRLEGPALSVSWDGTGYGSDATIWGGEFFADDGEETTRIASLIPFPLVGGDSAAREPRRSAVGMLYACVGESVFDRTDLAPIASFSPGQRSVLRTAIRSPRGSVPTSSAGRLFDGVASLLGVRQQASFEGQAAMELEGLAVRSKSERGFPFEILEEPGIRPVRVDWRPTVLEIIEQHRSGIDCSLLARGFHVALAEMIAAVARWSGFEQIMVTGGCFQNRLLLELVIRRVHEDGKKIFWHREIPPNDGGIALGQAAVAVRPAERPRIRTGLHAGERSIPCV